MNGIGRVKITTAKQLFLDPYDRNRFTGGFVIIDPNDFRTVGAAMIRHSSRSTIDELKREARGEQLSERRSENVVWDQGLVTTRDRISRNTHRPLCHNERRHYFVGRMVRVLDVSRSRYNASLRRKPSRRDREDEQLVEEIGVVQEIVAQY